MAYTYNGFGELRTLTTWRNAGAFSANGRNSAYTPNALNQYTQRDVPGVADILGSAHPEATVTINDTATQRQNGLFYRQFGVNNTSGPVLLTATTTGVRKGAGADGKDVVTQTVGSLYVPQTPEVYAYDDDGNLTQDGRWIYTWDGENRLVAMEVISTVPVAAKKKLEFAYSAEGKRIQKKVYRWDSQINDYQLASEKRFVYDGWNVIAEMDATNTVERSYLWGQDLSGTLQGAGGVGGLLAVTTTGTNSGTYLATTDVNGNVLGLVDSQGTVVATYEYGPFGEPIRVSEAMAAQNPFRFSTKYTDDESGLVYYGYRYYAPNTGRWISRDAIEERGDVNLFSAMKNSLLSYIDPDGYMPIKYDDINGPGTRNNNDFPDIPSPRGPSIRDPFFPGNPDNTAWFDQNHSAAIEEEKQRVKNYFNIQFREKCKNKSLQIKDWTDGWTPSQSYLSSGYVLGGVSFTAKAPNSTLKNCCYSWTTSLTITDTVGPDSRPGSSTVERGIAKIWNAIGLPSARNVTRASWNISGKACCN